MYQGGGGGGGGGTLGEGAGTWPGSASSPHRGRWSCLGIVTSPVPVQQGRLGALARIWSFLQTIPAPPFASLDQLQEGQWQNRTCCAEPPVPREQGAEGWDADCGTEATSACTFLHLMAAGSRLSVGPGGSSLARERSDLSIKVEEGGD